MSTTNAAHGRPTKGRVAVYAASSVLAVVVLFPLVWALITSFKVSDEVQSSPPNWFPTRLTVSSYTGVLDHGPLKHFLGNTLVVAGGATIVTLLIAVHAAYAITRFTFKGRGIGSFILLMSMMIPTVSIILPQFILASKLSLVDTRLVLIIIDSAWQIPLAVWVMRAYFYRVPGSIDEAAMLDGCSRLKAFYRVVLPLSWPGIAAAGVVVFIWVWNEFLIGLTLTTSVSAKPIAPGLYSYVTDQGVQWGTLTAAAVVAMVPVVAIFIVLQRRFVEGLTAGTGK